MKVEIRRIEVEASWYRVQKLCLFELSSKRFTCISYILTYLCVLWDMVPGSELARFTGFWWTRFKSSSLNMSVSSCSDGLNFPSSLLWPKVSALIDCNNCWVGAAGIAKDETFGWYSFTEGPSIAGSPSKLTNAYEKIKLFC